MMFSEQDSYCGMIDNYQDGSVYSEQTTGYPVYPSSELFSRSHSPRTVKRINSNARKRLRQHIVNEAFLKLRDMVPARRPEKKMSKLQILKSATRYINYLTQVLQRDQDINSQDKQDQMVTSTTDFYDLPASCTDHSLNTTSCQLIDTSKSCCFLEDADDFF